MTKLLSPRLRITVWTAALLLILFGSAQMSNNVQGQEAGAEPAAAADEAADTTAPDEEADAGDSALTSLGDHLFKVPESVAEWVGVGFYVVLLIFSLFAATIIFERLFRLKRERIAPVAFCERLKNILASGQGTLQNFGGLCDSSATPISRILRAGVLVGGRPLPEVEKSIEDAIAREMSALRAMHRPLSVIASVAPLIGLLGTVVGMIFAFGAASVAGLGSGEGLLQGLFVALWTTAGGLTIAIPCLLFAAWFNTKVDRFFREIDELLLETMPSFAHVENGTGYVAAAAQQRTARDEGDSEPVATEAASDQEPVAAVRPR
jgi:biopolymer transport protein ExbB